jgi:CheY-like chemotaxis protein
MNGVIGISNLLSDTSLDVEQREYVEALTVSGEALITVIKNVFDFSKLKADTLAFDKAPFDLRKLVEDVCSTVSLDSPGDVRLFVSFDSRLPERVLGDSDHVRQVLLNLAGNAVKFTDTGVVTIRVSWDEEEMQRDQLRVEVADTGIGIDPFAQQLIFKPFAQVDSSTTRRHGGTGLGLTIAKELVELMGGEIGLRSAVGEGSTFWFTLPIRAASAASTEAFSSLEGVRVLVADADETSRRLVERHLRDWDMTVATAANAHATLDALRSAARSTRPYDVLLLDVGLPGMASDELVREIEADGTLRSAQIVVTLPDGLPAGLTINGVKRQVTKPVLPGVLYGEIARAVDHDDDEQEPTGRRPVQQTRDGQTARILVAEGNASNELVAVCLLQRRGFRVDVARNGHEAVAMHELAPYDAIFMDCMLPQLDGYDATREIRRREGDTRRTPIIAMTANTASSDAQRCLAAGMDFYSGKPIGPAGLDYVIDRALSAYSGPTPKS